MTHAQEVWHVTVRGRVQGVGYRYFTQDCANELGVKGWVRNRPDGSVEALGAGSPGVLEEWVRRLRQGPPLSRVENLDVQMGISPAPNCEFEIRP